jgi:signal transduction histidine kinase
VGTLRFVHLAVLALACWCAGCIVPAAAQPAARIGAVRVLELADPGSSPSDDAVARLALAAGRELARPGDAPSTPFEAAWVAMRLERDGDARPAGFLRVNSLSRREIDAWLVVDGMVVAHKVGGYARVAGIGAMARGDFALPLAAWTGREAIVVLRSVATEPRPYDPSFAQADELDRIAIARAGFLLFLAGAVCVFVGFQVVMFASLRERAAIDSAIFSTLVVLVSLVRPAFLPVDVSLGSTRILAGDHVTVLRFLSLLAGLRMVDSLLGLRQAGCRLWACHQSVMLGSAGIGLAALAMGTSPFVYVVSALLVLGSLWVLVPIVLSMHRGAPGAAFLLVGFLGLIVSISLSNLIFLGLLQGMGRLEFWVPLGLLWQIAFSTVALGWKFSQLREDRHRVELRDAEVSGLARLVRVVCHDVSNPLMRVQLFHERLKRQLASGERPDALAGTLGKAMQAAGGIGAVIDEVRTREMLRQGGGRLPVERVDVAALAKDALEMCEERAAAKGVAIRMRPHAPAFGLANAAVLVHSVLANLLSNAIKFSPRGGAIDVELVAAPARVGVRISDDGPGVPASTIAALEGSAVVASRHGTSGEGGTGFGLALARDFTAAMGGELLIESREGHAGRGTPGTTATVWLAAD